MLWTRGPWTARAAFLNKSTILPEVPKGTDGYRFSDLNNTITVEMNAFMQFAARVKSKMADVPSSRTLMWLLLILSGDISQNPGPTTPTKSGLHKHYKYPCGICEKPVKSNQKGVQCDSCDLWYHLRCLSMCSEDYEGLANASVWICSSCDYPNFSSSITSSDHPVEQSNLFSYLDQSEQLESTTGPDLGPESEIGPPLFTSSPPSTIRSSNTRDIKLCSININSIRGKILEFQSFVETESPDVIAVQETKIDSSVTNAELLPSELGYSIIRKDRCMGGGGVLLAVKSELNRLSCLDLEIASSESIWSKISLKGHVHYFGSYYRPPDQHHEEIQSLRNQLDSIRNSHPPNRQPSIHVMGDFNFRKIDWTTHLTREGDTLCNSDGLQLIDITRNHYMDQLITFPTRGNKTLDLIFTNSPGLVNNCCSPDKLSDHATVICTLNVSAPFKRRPQRKVYLFNKGDLASLRNDLQEFQETFLQSATNDSQIEDDWNLFKTVLKHSMDRHIPSKTVSGRDKLPWLSASLRRLIRRKNRIHAKYKRTGNQRLYALWRKLRRKVTVSLKSERNKYVNKVIGDIQNNPKPFWKFIRSQRKDNQALPPLKTPSGTTAESDLEKAEMLNTQFQNNFSNEDLNSIPLLPQTIPGIRDICVTTQGIYKLLNELKPSKSAGPDEIHPRILKETATQIAPVLKFIFEKSLRTCDLPEDWRTANICPIFKKGDRSIPNNYRPVSLTSVVCKVLEHIVCSSLMSHLDSHGIISNRQHAFRKGRSCTTQLCTVLHDWCETTDQGLQTDAFILDFAKAFDSVPHERLKTKLHRYGITGKTLGWIDNFLCCRYQRVVVNGSKSRWIPVISGVPQGTVLGPVLFNVFINDIIEGIDSDIRLFADDCVCYRPIKNIQDCRILQEDINHLAAWANNWCMSFEPSKCKTMYITRKTTHKITHPYSMNGFLLESVSHTKYLGVTISEDLKRNRHVAEVTSRANKLLGLLRRNLSVCDKKVKEAAYLGLVRPLLEYASQAWDPHTSNLTDEIEKVQRRAARFVMSDYKNYEPGSVTNLLNRLGWHSLQKRREIDRLCLFKKGLDNRSLLPLDSLVRPSRKTRQMHSAHYIPLYTRTNIYKFSFIPRSIVNWNALPQQAVVIADPGISQFRQFLTSM